MEVNGFGYNDPKLDNLIWRWVVNEHPAELVSFNEATLLQENKNSEREVERVAPVVDQKQNGLGDAALGAPPKGVGSSRTGVSLPGGASNNNDRLNTGGPASSFVKSSAKSRKRPRDEEKMDSPEHKTVPVAEIIVSGSGF